MEQATAIQMGADREMPRYKSHKTVWALKIAAIETVEQACSCTALIGYSSHCAEHGGNDEVEGAEITPAEEGYGKFRVSRAYVKKHNPQAGGYYVVYADGYKSWSPAEAFEEGYTRL